MELKEDHVNTSGQIGIATADNSGKENSMHKGNTVKMNNKYYVSERNRDKEFKVTTEPQEVCGTMCVWLEGFRGCYATDGLTVVN